MQRPNILFLFTDQQRFDTIAAHGNPNLQTPVLDGLVQSGVSFTRAYTPCPVCVPARYSLATGLMPHQTGLTDNGPMEHRDRSFMEMLSEAGYQGFGAGKMHMTFPGGPDQLWGFEKRACNEGVGDQNHFRQNLDKNGFAHVADSMGARSEMYYIPQVSQLPAHLHHTAWTVSSCLDFLAERDESRPFLMMASFEKPHPPFEPPVPWNKLYRGAAMPDPKMPTHPEECHTFWNRFQNRYKYRDSGIDRNLLRTMKAYYYAEISFIDFQIGRILQQLERDGLRENTLILLAADHGELMGDYGCFGKRCFLDSAARIPLVLSYPGGPQDVRCDAPVNLVDILPTFLSAAGAQVPDRCQGADLRAIGEGKVERNATYGQFQSGCWANYMVCNRNYKYIYSAPDRREYFFDLLRDPQELENRAGSTLYAHKIAEMRQSALDYFADAEGAVENGSWKSYPKAEFTNLSQQFLLHQDPPASLPDLPGYSDELSRNTYEELLWPGAGNRRP